MLCLHSESSSGKKNSGWPDSTYTLSRSLSASSGKLRRSCVQNQPGAHAGIFHLIIWKLVRLMLQLFLFFVILYCLHLACCCRLHSSPPHLLYLCSFQVLGNAGLSLQQEFYTIERLPEEIAGSAFVSLDHVPDHRLRPMIHILLCLFFPLYLIHLFFLLPRLGSMVWWYICLQDLLRRSFGWLLLCTSKADLCVDYNFLNKRQRLFLRQLVQSCPQEYYDGLLCPLLGPLFTYMLQVTLQLCLFLISPLVMYNLFSQVKICCGVLMACLHFNLQRLNVKWQIINQRTSVK